MSKPSVTATVNMQSLHTPNSMHPTKSIADLEKFVREHAVGSLQTLDDFAKYWNDFDAIARNLLENKLINKAERDLYFWTGIPHAARKSIGQQLSATDLSYHERLIPPWRDVIQAGRIVFNDPAVRIIGLYSRQYSVSMQLDSSKQSQDIDKLVRTLHGLGVDDPNYAVAYARLLVTAPAVADRIQPPPRWTRSSANNSLSVPHSPSPTMTPHIGGSSPCRQTLRRVQSYVSYQWCPNCAEQHVVHRAPST